jgi:hypothetical protein
VKKKPSVGMLERLIGQVCNTAETACPEQYLPSESASKSLTEPSEWDTTARDSTGSKEPLKL